MHLTKITSAAWNVVDDGLVLAIEARLLENLHLLFRLQPQRVDAGQPVVARRDLGGEWEGEGEGGGEDRGPRFETRGDVAF